MQGGAERVTPGGSTPGVLFVHGQPGSGSDWDPVRALLADGPVLAPDRPGYGSSPHPPASIAANAHHLARLVADEGVAPVVVVGHSYGGAIAALLAARFPELVDALVLVGTVGLARSVHLLDRVMGVPVLGDAVAASGIFALGRVLPMLREGLAGGLPARVVPPAQAAWLRATLPDARLGALHAHGGRPLWRTFVHEQRALLGEIADVEAALRSLALPTAVVSGSWDVVVPPKEAAGVAAVVPGAQFVLLARAGHFVNRDRPVALARVIEQLRHRERDADDGAEVTDLDPPKAAQEG